MSCLQGFFHLPKDDFEAVKRGTISTVTCVSFGSPGDDTHVQCNGVAKPAAIKRRDGTLAFASTKGLILIDPRSDLRRNEKPPPVVVDSIIAGGSHEFVCGKTDAAGIKIPPGESVAIHYTALSFRAPEKNRFRYKLENFNDEWIDAGTDRIANYSKLPHGDYRFRVLACNNDGIGSEQGAEVAFSVLPEFWQTWWFKAISFGGVGALGFLGYRTRVARIRQLEGLRLRIAADLHDDIGADLTKLSLLVESAMRDHAQQGRTRSALEEAMTTSREVIMAMDEIVWTIKPKNDTLENLANYIFRYSQRYCKNTGIRCTLDIPADLPALKVPTDVRHNLFLAFKEALHNSVKHSQACEVKVSFGCEQRVLLLSVADDGIGIPEKTATSGNGLANMQRRMELIRGEFRVTSQRGRGTQIQLQVKV